VKAGRVEEEDEDGTGEMNEKKRWKDGKIEELKERQKMKEVGKTNRTRGRRHA
jgi:hypothetical protein